MGAFEGTKTEDAAEQWPQMGNIGDNDSCGRLARVPIEIDETAVASCKVVITVQNCGQDDENTQTENRTEHDFPRE